MGYFEQYNNEDDPSFSVIIEDDDKVCYAYLLEGDQIVGDVWLYNNIETPQSVDWGNKEDLPFANPKTFVKDDIPPFDESTLINVQWGVNDDKVWAELYSSGALLVKLEVGAFLDGLLWSKEMALWLVFVKRNFQDEYKPNLYRIGLYNFSIACILLLVRRGTSLSAQA